MRVDWPVLVACILAPDDGRDMLRSLWLASCEVLENLPAYVPADCEHFPPLLEGLTAEDLAKRVLDPKTDQATPLGVVFGRWRASVTDVEARNAAKLQTLAFTLRTLTDLYAKSTEPNLVAIRIEALGAFLERAWHVAIPLHGDLRSWSARITRRYDLLPRAWREL